MLNITFDQAEVEAALLLAYSDDEVVVEAWDEHTQRRASALSPRLTLSRYLKPLGFTEVRAGASRVTYLHRDELALKVPQVMKTSLFEVMEAEYLISQELQGLKRLRRWFPELQPLNGNRHFTISKRYYYPKEIKGFWKPTPWLDTVKPLEPNIDAMGWGSKEIRQAERIADRLGIGDMHEGNFMVDKETRQLVFVDFGHPMDELTKSVRRRTSNRRERNA